MRSRASSNISEGSAETSQLREELASLKTQLLEKDIEIEALKHELLAFKNLTHNERVLLAGNVVELSTQVRTASISSGVDTEKQRSVADALKALEAAAPKQP